MHYASTRMLSQRVSTARSLRVGCIIEVTGYEYWYADCLGRRRPESLSRHFPNSPTGLIESGRVSVSFWKFMKTKIEDMSDKAPDLNDLKLGGGTEDPGLDHPLMPNLGAVVSDPDGPQTPTGMQTSFHNDAGDTATPGEAAGVNPSRNPSITTAARADTPFILGRLERYS